MVSSNPRPEGSEKGKPADGRNTVHSQELRDAETVLQTVRTVYSHEDTSESMSSIPVRSPFKLHL